MKDKEIVIYQAESGAIQLRSDTRADTIWATQKQIAEIFSVKIPAINKHIKNILAESELDDSTISILEIVQQEGVRQVNRKVEHYNLDMLISIGYRVNSKTATKFRQWATQIFPGNRLVLESICKETLQAQKVNNRSLSRKAKEPAIRNFRIAQLSEQFLRSRCLSEVEGMR